MLSSEVRSSSISRSARWDWGDPSVRWTRSGIVPGGSSEFVSRRFFAPTAESFRGGRDGREDRGESLLVPSLASSVTSFAGLGLFGNHHPDGLGLRRFSTILLV